LLADTAAAKGPGADMAALPQSYAIRLLLADDHPVMRDGLKFMLARNEDITILAEAADGIEAVELFAKHRPNVVLIDLQMPRMGGLEAITRIRRMDPNVAIIVLTTFHGDFRAARALAAGATSYLLKSTNAAEIVGAIRNAVAGEATISPEVADELSRFSVMQPLTEREIAVLRLIAKGKRNHVIGHILCISEEAVKSRIKNILQKLDARDRTQAVTIAAARGFLS
jgi:DNA-binding NarL/FixJ family response regulator